MAGPTDRTGCPGSALDLVGGPQGAQESALTETLEASLYVTEADTHNELPHPPASAKEKK